MAADTIDQLAGYLQRLCPLADPLLARKWIDIAFRELADAEDWTWKTGTVIYTFPAEYATGTATIGVGETEVTLAGATVTTDWVGRQFRSGNSGIYTILYVNDVAGTLTLDKPWGAAALAAASYQIYKAYITAPSDFEGWLSVLEPAEEQTIDLQASQDDLNACDPVRSDSGAPLKLAFLDVSPSFEGSVDAPVRAHGTGDSPSSSGAYTGLQDGLYVVEVEGGALSFKWHKDGGTVTSGVAMVATPTEMGEGVNVYWAAGLTFVAGDVFAIAVKAGRDATPPRFEVWPHPTDARYLHLQYRRRLPDLTEDGATLPFNVRGDVLLAGGQVECAKWPGPSVEQRNPYYVLGLQDRLRIDFERGIQRMRTLDAEIRPTAIDNYAVRQQRRGGGSFGRSASWNQSHDGGIL